MKIDWKSHLANRSGTSIVIALVLIAAITFFTIGISSTAITALRTTNYSKKALQSEYAAQGALEIVKKEVNDTPVGQESDYSSGLVFIEKSCEGGTESCEDDDAILENSIYADVKLETVNNSVDREYSGSSLGDRSVPIMGYGNAGEDCDLVSLGDLQGHPNHPCNWNKIYYGESVNIPLFTKEAGDAHTSDIGDGDLAEFNIRVRTPCMLGYEYTLAGTSESDCKRYVLIPNSLSGPEGDIVVNWQILADCVLGSGDSEVCSVTHHVESGSAFQEGLFTGIPGEYVTVDKEKRVYDVYGNSDGTNAPLDYMQNFLKHSHTWDGFGWIDNTFLKLSYVKEALAGSTNVPYMEYQLMYGDDIDISANPVFSVDAYAEGFKYSLEGVRDIGSNLFDFAVQN